MVIGVASITGVHLLSAQIAQQVQKQAEPVSRVDLYLSRPALADNDYFALREAWRAGRQPAIDKVFPLLEGTVEFADQTLFVTGTDPLALGFSIFGDTGVANEDAVAREGVAANGNESIGAYLSTDSVFLAPSMRDQVDVGDRILLGNVRVLVLGHSAPEGVVLADLPTARRILNSTGLSRVGVVLTPQALKARGWRLRWLADRLFPGALPARPAEPLPALEQATQRSDWTQTPAAGASPVVQLLQSVLFNVAMLSMLSLVVAWLLTYQVACHALTRRQAMFARLQSLGVARTRLRRLTLVEGLALGLVATLFGTLLGLWLANLLSSLMLGRPFAWLLNIDYFVWAKALGSGVGVAGFSYWLAARDEIFDSRPGQTALPKTGTGVENGLWLAGLLLVFLIGLFVPATGLPGAFACILCCALLLIVFLPRLAGLVWRATLPLESNSGLGMRAQAAPLTQLGRRQVLVGQELRLGISALTLSLATALGISVMVDSFRGAFVDMLDRRLADDAVLVLREPANSAVRAELASATAPVISGPILWRGTAPVRSDGVAGRLEFAERYDELLLRFVAPNELPQDLSTGVFVNESYARLQNLTAGSTLELAGQAGGEAVMIRGVFTDYGEVRPRLLGTVGLAQRLAGPPPLTDAYVATDDLSGLRDALASWTIDSRLSVRDQGQVRARSLEIFAQTFAITRALTWLALLVAVVALANALAAHSLQMAAADRQLQVLGISPAAARWLRLRRTFYATAIALLLALPLGFAIAALLCGVVNPRAFGWSFAMLVTWPGVGWPLLGGIVGGALASVLGLWLARRQRAAGVVPGGYAVALVACVALLMGCSETADVDQPDAHTMAEHAPAPAPAPAPALRVGSLLGGAAAGFERATAVREFEFPRDHGAHPTFRSEWWYLTCPLRERSPGKPGDEYGVQFTLFRQGLLPLEAGTANADSAWRTGQVYMAHAALTNVATNRHLESSRFARGHPRLAGVSTEPFAAWLENWRFESTPDGARSIDSGDAYRLDISAKEFSVVLSLQAQKSVVLQGDRGLSYKGSSEASYYYSLPRLAAEGWVSFREHQAMTQAEVSGACWFDREWSTSVLAAGLRGWDWFALQFDDQTEMMLFQLRGQSPEAEGKFARRQGKAVAASGTATTIPPDELRFTVARYWRDETGVDWPVEWQVSIAGRTLRVQAALDDQRMRETVAYWEGLVWVYEGDARIGQGYLEMTGYSGQHTNEQ